MCGRRRASEGVAIRSYREAGGPRQDRRPSRSNIYVAKRGNQHSRTRPDSENYVASGSRCLDRLPIIETQLLTRLQRDGDTGSGFGHQFERELLAVGRKYRRIRHTTLEQYRFGVFGVQMRRPALPMNDLRGYARQQNRRAGARNPHTASAWHGKSQAENERGDGSRNGEICKLEIKEVCDENASTKCNHGEQKRLTHQGFSGVTASILLQTGDAARERRRLTVKVDISVYSL